MNARTLGLIAAATLALVTAGAAAQDAAAPRAHDPRVGQQIAELGNRALATIRTELDTALKHGVALPELPVRVDLSLGDAVGARPTLADEPL